MDLTIKRRNQLCHLKEQEEDFKECKVELKQKLNISLFIWMRLSRMKLMN
jgi:hypothetical protein